MVGESPLRQLSLEDLVETSSRRVLVIDGEICDSPYFSITLRGTRWSDINLGEIIDLQNGNNNVGSVRVVGLALVPYYFATMVGASDWRVIDRVFDNDPRLSIGNIRLESARRMTLHYGRVEQTTLCTVLFLSREK